MHKLLIFLSFLFLLGCASTQDWSKSGSTETEFKQACFECEMASQAAYAQPAPYRQAYYTGTYGQMQSAGDDLTQLGFQLRQQSQRQEIFDKCMEARGFRKD
jgi:hypothetical protein